jgi:hypothetical protein
MLLHTAAGTGTAKVAAVVVVTAITLPLLVASVPVTPAAVPPGPTAGAASGQPATVDQDPNRRFVLAGAPTAPLHPGGTVPVRLSLTNRSGLPVAVEELVVTVERVDAAAVGCRPDDFATLQFSGQYGFRIGADETTDLSELGFPPAQWPQLTMVYRPTVNQDACKGASVSLALNGSAVGVAS